MKPTPEVIDAEFSVLAPRYEWRIRFWPSLLFWVYVTGVIGAAQQMLPGADPAAIAAVVLMSAVVGPLVRCLSAMLSALTGGSLVDAQAAQLERSRRLARERSRLAR